MMQSRMTVRSGVTRVIDTPDGPVRRYYPTREEQFERIRRDRERNLRRAAAQQGRSRRQAAIPARPCSLTSPGTW
jgi:hypothetical protein